jgi:hypothetical protein
MTKMCCSKCGSTEFEPIRSYYELGWDDLHKTVIKFNGRAYPFPGGRVREFDLGKRCKVVKGHMYMENQEQYEERTGNGTR